MQDAMLHYIRLALATQARKGGPLNRVGDQSISGGNPPCGIFPCKGGGPNDYVYVYTSRTNPEHWKRLLGVIGRMLGRGHDAAQIVLYVPIQDKPEAAAQRLRELAAVARPAIEHQLSAAYRQVAAP